MELKRDTEIKETIIFQTGTHHLKVSKERLDRFDDTQNSLKKLRTFIQKNMKQSIEVCDGRDWESSFQLMFREISGGQTILNGDN